MSVKKQLIFLLLLLIFLGKKKKKSLRPVGNECAGCKVFVSPNDFANSVDPRPATDILFNFATGKKPKLIFPP